MKKKPTAYGLYRINQKLADLLKELNEFSVTPATYECSSHAIKNLEEAFKSADAWLREVAADERLEDINKEIKNDEFSQFKTCTRKIEF